MEELLKSMTAVELAELADKKTAMDFKERYHKELHEAASEGRKPLSPSQIMIQMAESGDYPQHTRRGINCAIQRVNDAINHR